MLKTPKLVLVSASLLVSACVGEGVNTPSTIPAQEVPPAVPVPAVMGTSLDEINAKAAPATSEIAKPDGTPNIRPEPEELMGKEIIFIEETFGRPFFLRWEQKIRVLQYKSTACVMDMYFYEEGLDKSLILKHYDSRDTLGNDKPARDCIASLLPNHLWANGLDINGPKN